ncbi:MAG: hypothetical protein NTX77_01500 [Actinobacteria bacterium]|nr:hypothetical protein [Actinomycetota bacterium]
MNQKRLAIAGMTGALLIGAGTGVVLNLPAGAGASGASVAAATTPSVPADPTAIGDGGHGGHGAMLADSLSKLVTDGTITQAQADSITAALEANRPAGMPDDGMGGPGMGRHHGKGGPGMGGEGKGGPGMGRGRGAGLEAAATALGITADELRTELQGGKSIADVATAKGVNVQTVIDALVAQAKTRITDMVNGVRPAAPADQPDAPATTSGATNG